MRITKAEPRGPALTVYESKITEQTVLNPKKFYQLVYIIKTKSLQSNITI